MRSTWRRLSLALGLAAGLAACQAPPESVYATSVQQTASAETVPVGNNQVGEACRYQPSPAAGIAVSARIAVAVRCGSWQAASGQIFEIADSSPARLRELATVGPWRNYINARFDCSAPTETRILNGAPAFLMQCMRRNGGWPQLALTAAIGDRVFAADGVPSSLPALEATLGVLTGQRAAAPGGKSDAEQLIAGRGADKPFGSGDLGRFYELTRLGDAYNNVDEPAQAEQAFREALAVQQRLLGNNNPGLALTEMKLAAQISHQRSAPEADQLIASAATLTARANDPLLSAQLDYYRAVTAAYEQRDDVAMQQAAVAEGAFTRLLPIGTEQADDSRPGTAPRSRGLDVALLTDDAARDAARGTALTGLAETLRLRASLLRKKGDDTQSSTLALRADRLLAANGLGLSSTGARSLRLVANNEATAGNYPTAGTYSAEAQRVFERVVPGEHPEALNALQEGSYRLEQGQTTQALALFRRAGQILRNPAVTGGARPDYILPWINALYGEAQQNPANRAQLDAEAFEAAQFATDNRTALDIAQATARLAAGNPAAAAVVRAYQDRERDFERLQSQRDAAVAEGGSAARITAIDAQITEAQKSRDEAESAIPAAAPHYLEASEKPASAKDVQGLLGAGDALVFFFVADKGSYGFLVRQGGTVLYRIPLNQAQMAAVINKLRYNTVARSGGLPNFDFATGYQLYGALFGPIEAGLAGVSEVTVATTGDLLRFPLAALVTQPGVAAGNGDYRKVPWLVRRYALSYVPSPRIFVNLREGKGGAAGSRPFIGFGDFHPASPAQIAASFPPDRCRDDYQTVSSLPRLPETGTQVQTIAQRLGAGPGDIVLGDSFTKARLLQPDLSQYRIVLLATHALLPEDLKCQSEPSVIVSAAPGAPNAGGEFLQASDIENMKLDADLVVLSACDTAGASAKTGESLSGLARAFFRAGAHGLMVTHWDVVTGASVQLMTATFSTAGAGSAAALRTAQLQMIDGAGSGGAPIEASYPNYWAAFFLIGDGVRGRGPGA